MGAKRSTALRTLAGVGVAALALLIAACGSSADGSDPARGPADARSEQDTGILDASRAPIATALAIARAPEIPQREPFLPPDAERTPDGELIVRDDARPAEFGFDWLTNFGIRIVRFDEFNTRLLRDDIAALTGPRFVPVADVASIYVDWSPMLFLELNGDVRAYPLEIMLWHEIVNDVVGGIPVVVTYCPLCNTAIVLERQVGERSLVFGASGILRKSDLVMYDLETESLWQQVGGKALVGDMVGARLGLLPASIVGFGQIRDAFPNALVLSRETGSGISYGGTPYTVYDAVDDRPDQRRLYVDADPRLPFAERVVGVRIGEAALAFPLPLLMERRVVAAEVGGRPIVVFWTPGARSALDQPRIDQSRDVGSAAVFGAEVDGKRLRFAPNPEDPGTFVDENTGSVWDIFGRAVQGPLRGARLTPVLHGTHLWFAWAAFEPETAIAE